MRDYVGVSNKARRKFWDEMNNYPIADPPPPPDVERLLNESIPKGGVISRKILSRRKGGGSLGVRAILPLRNGAAARWCARPRRSFRRPGTGPMA